MATVSGSQLGGQQQQQQQQQQTCGSQPCKQELNDFWVWLTGWFFPWYHLLGIIWELVKPEIKNFICSISCLVLGALCAVVMPYLNAMIIASLSEMKKFSMGDVFDVNIKYLVPYVFFILGNTLFNSAWKGLFFRSAQNISSNMKGKISEGVILAENKEMLREGHALVKKFIVTYFPATARNIIAAFGGAIFMCVTSSWKLSLPTLAFMVAMLLADYWFEELSLRAGEDAEFPEVGAQASMRTRPRVAVWIGIRYAIFHMFCQLAIILLSFYALSTFRSSKSIGKFSAFVLYGFKVWFAMSSITKFSTAREFGYFDLFLRHLDSLTATSEEHGQQKIRASPELTQFNQGTQPIREDNFPTVDVIIEDRGEITEGQDDGIRDFKKDGDSLPDWPADNNGVSKKEHDVAVKKLTATDRNLEGGNPSTSA